MKFNVDALIKLIDERYKGNYKSFSNDININSITVWRIINRKANAGEKFLTTFMQYCIEKGESFESFFITSVA